ncbi:DUF1565 domain-containing protein [Candidatus Sumerlaeota bacterium]|nr:DUF1565 domain-containing protein [Candidatus Sumerlaeota bacterium]
MFKHIKSLVVAVALLVTCCCGSANAASLTVNLEPAYAPVNGAKWTVDDGTTWYASGDTATLDPGTYTVKFNAADSGWTAANQAVELTDTSVQNVTLTPVVGYWGAHSIRGDGQFTKTANGVKATFIDNGTKKIGYGTRDYNGMTLGEFAGINWERPGTVGTYQVYYNIWVTDGSGHYALLCASKYLVGSDETETDRYEFLNSPFIAYEAGERSVANLGWMTPEMRGVNVAPDAGYYMTRDAAGTSKLVMADISHLTIDVPPVGGYPGTVGTGASRAGYGVYCVLVGGQGASGVTPKEVEIANVAVTKYNYTESIAAGEWFAQNETNVANHLPSIRPTAANGLSVLIDYNGAKVTAYNKGLAGLKISDFGKFSFNVDKNLFAEHHDVWPTMRMFVTDKDKKLVIPISPQDFLNREGLSLNYAELLADTQVYNWGSSFIWDEAQSKYVKNTTNDYSAIGAKKMAGQSERLFNIDDDTPLTFSDLIAQDVEFASNHPWYPNQSFTIDFGQSVGLAMPDMIVATDMSVKRGYAITTSCGEGGSITPTTNAPEGEDYTVTITPLESYNIASLTVDGVEVEPTATYTFTNVAATHTVAATFAIKTFTVTATAGENGTISPNGEQTVNYGDDLAFTITPATNYHIESLVVDGTTVTAATSYTFENVTADHTIAATFARDMGTLKVNITGPTKSAWSVDGGTTWNAGGSSININTGSYTVTFKSVHGWVTPTAIPVTITTDATIEESATYTEDPSTLSWYVATTGSDETGDGSETNPFATIAFAIDCARAGDIVYVAAGEYLVSETIEIDKPLALLGPNADKKGYAEDRGAEAVIKADIANFQDFVNADMIDIVSRDVTISGLTLDGMNSDPLINPNLNDGLCAGLVPYFVGLDNADVNVVLTNNRVINFNTGGVYTCTPAPSAAHAATGILVKDNYIANIAYIGLVSTNNCDLNAYDNFIENCIFGVAVESVAEAPTGMPIDYAQYIKGNTIKNCDAGVRYNHSSFTHRKYPLYIAENTIFGKSNITNGVTRGYTHAGITTWAFRPGDVVIIEDNIIRNKEVGLAPFNNPGSDYVHEGPKWPTIRNNTLENNDIGILASTRYIYGGFTYMNFKFSIEGGTITVPDGGKGIVVSTISQLVASGYALGVNCVFDGITVNGGDKGLLVYAEDGGVAQSWTLTNDVTIKNCTFTQGTTGDGTVCVEVMTSGTVVSAVDQKVKVDTGCTFNGMLLNPAKAAAKVIPNDATTVSYMTGTETVTIVPAEAIAAGAQWKIAGGDAFDSGWLDSGVALSVPFGRYTVSFKDIPFYTTPSSRLVNMNVGDSKTATGTYVEKGQLEVTLLPTEAAAAGARWSLDGGQTWRTSGIAKLDEGDYLIMFKDLPRGWITPADASATVVRGETAQVSGVYTATGELLDWYVSTTGSDETGDGSEANPLATIAFAVECAREGETIHVAAGEYILSDTLFIDKPLTVVGPNADKTGFAEDRGAEALLKPALPDMLEGVMVEITSEDVTFSGFELDGQNDNFLDGYTGIAYGLLIYLTGEHPSANINILNNRFSNMGDAGVYSFSPSYAGANHANGIEAVGNYVTNAWFGFVSDANVDMNVRNNKAELCRIGLVLEKSIGQCEDTPADYKQYFENNLTVDCFIGFRYNNWPSQSRTSEFVLRNNTFDGYNPALGNETTLTPGGILMYALIPKTNVITIENNTFKNQKYGATLWGAQTLNLRNNNFIDNEVGIRFATVIDYSGGPDGKTWGSNMNQTITGNSFTIPAGGTGVLVDAMSTTINTSFTTWGKFNANLNLENCTFTGGAKGLAVQVTDPTGLGCQARASIKDCSFTQGEIGDGTYCVDATTATSVKVDTGCTFNGMLLNPAKAAEKVIPADDTVSYCTGNLTVTLTPSEAVALGAQWKIAGGDAYDSGWQNSGATLAAPFGDYTLIFKDIDIYATPATQSVTIVKDGESTATAEYVERAQINVTLTPAEAAAAGAKWSIDGGTTWNASGASVKADAGTYTLSFQAPPRGWTAPASETVELVSGIITEASGVFVKTAGILDWYVATTGSDETGDGSEANPFATVKFGIACAREGDIVHVAAGEYLISETIEIDKPLSLLGPNSDKKGYAEDRGAEAVIKADIANFPDFSGADMIDILSRDVTVSGLSLNGMNSDPMINPDLNDGLSAGLVPYFVGLDNADVNVVLTNNRLSNFNTAGVYAFCATRNATDAANGILVKDNYFSEIAYIGAISTNNCEFDAIDNKFENCWLAMAFENLNGSPTGTAVDYKQYVNGNTIVDCGVGIRFNHSLPSGGVKAAELIISNNTITGRGQFPISHTPCGLTVWSYADGDRVTFENNVVENNECGVDMYSYKIFNGYPKMLNNTFTNNDIGILISDRTKYYSPWGPPYEYSYRDVAARIEGGTVTVPDGGLGIVVANVQSPQAKRSTIAYSTSAELVGLTVTGGDKGLYVYTEDALGSTRSPAPIKTKVMIKDCTFTQGEVGDETVCVEVGTSGTLISPLDQTVKVDTGCTFNGMLLNPAKAVAKVIPNDTTTVTYYTGDLTVTLAPQEAITAGAQWKIAGGDAYDSGWKNSAEQLAVPAGDYTITYKDIEFFATPAPRFMHIDKDGTFTATGTYVAKSQIKVTLLPQGATYNGAWSIDGGTTWYKSGEIAKVDAGFYPVTFKPVYGWIAPSEQEVEVNEGETAEATATYTPAAGVLDWYVATTGSDETGDGSEANPFATIPFAVECAREGEIIHVAAGEYIFNEEVSIDKALTILGPNATLPAYAVDGNGVKSFPNTDRTAEAVLVNNMPCVTEEESVFGISTRDVTISGFTFDGLDVGSVGIKVSFAPGVYIGNANINLTNNIVKGISCYGYLVQYTGSGEAQYSSNGILAQGNYFTDNFMGILAYNNVVLDIVDNLAENTTYAYRYEFYTNATPAGTITDCNVTGNSANNVHVGLMYNEACGGPGSGYHFNIKDNVFTQGYRYISSPRLPVVGLYLTTLGKNDDLVLDNNSVDGFEVGVEVNDIYGISNPIIQNSTFTNNTFGARVSTVQCWVNCIRAYATFNNCQFIDNETGFEVRGYYASATIPGNATAFLNDCTITGGNTGLNMVYDNNGGTAVGTATAGIKNCVFSQGVDLDGKYCVNALSENVSVKVDTGCTFNGYTLNVAKSAEKQKVVPADDTVSYYTGTETVTLEPAEAVTAGAQWKIAGGDAFDSGWLASAAMATVPVGGEYTISFKDVDGWIAPDEIEDVAITKDGTSQHSASYNPVISASAGENGTITPAGEVEVAYGEAQTFNFAPSTGYHVSKVLVDGTEVTIADSYTFEDVAVPHTIAVEFAIDTFTITASTGENGTITPSGEVTVNYGADQTFNFAANTGYHVAKVLVDGAEVAIADSYTFEDVVADHTIAVEFAIDTFTITASASGNGTITPSGEVTVNYGADQTFAFAKDTGYHIAKVVVDGAEVTIADSYTFTDVVANHTIAVEFAIDTFTITASTGENGTITPSGDVTVNYGADQTFDFAANTGYHVSKVVVDGAEVTVADSYTFEDVAADHTIAVEFAIDTFTITASAGENGTITPSGDVTVNYGEDQSFAIAANEDYIISDVTVDGESVGAVAEYTFTEVKADHQISVTFAAAGSVTINITGTSQGQWSTSLSGPWHNSGDKVYLLPDDYLIVFKSVAGFKAPDSFPVTVVVGEPQTFDKEYTRLINYAQWKLFGTYSLAGLTNATASTQHITADADKNIYIGGYGYGGTSQSDAALLKFAANGATAPETVELVGVRSAWGEALTNGYLGLSQTPDGGIFATMDGAASSPAFTLKLKNGGEVDTDWAVDGIYDVTAEAPRFQANAVLEDGTLALPRLMIGDNKSIRFVEQDGDNVVITNMAVEGDINNYARDAVVMGSNTMFILADNDTTIYKVLFNGTTLADATVTEFVKPTNAGTRSGLYFHELDNTLIHATVGAASSQQSINIYNAETGELVQSLSGAEVPATYNDVVVIPDAVNGDMMYAVSSDKQIAVYKHTVALTVDLSQCPEGAKWSIDGGTTWNDSMASVEVFDKSIATVTLSTVEGYEVPAPINVTIDGNTTYEVPASAYKTIYCDIKVTLEPAYAPVNGAKWSLDGGTTWYASGQTAKALCDVDQVITFNDTISGWAGEPVIVKGASGELVEETVTLTPVSGFWGGHCIRPSGSGDDSYELIENGITAGFTDYGTKKIGFGSRDFNGMKLNDIFEISWTAEATTDYETYFNVWVTDGEGHYALLSIDKYYQGSNDTMNGFYDLQNADFLVYEAGPRTVGNLGWMTPEFRGVDAGTYMTRDAAGSTAARLVLSDIGHLTIATPPAGEYPPTVGGGASKAGYGIYIVLVGGPTTTEALPATVKVTNPTVKIADFHAMTMAGDWISSETSVVANHIASIRAQSATAHNLLLDFDGATAGIYNKGLSECKLSDFGIFSFNINEEIFAGHDDMWPVTNFLIISADKSMIIPVAAKNFTAAKGAELNYATLKADEINSFGVGYIWNGTEFVEDTDNDYSAFNAKKIGDQLFAADGVTPLTFADLAAQGVEFTNQHPLYSGRSVYMKLGSDSASALPDMIQISNLSILRGFEVSTSCTEDMATITPTTNVPQDTDFTVVITPKTTEDVDPAYNPIDPYEVYLLKVDGVEVAPTTTVTFEDVQATHTVEAFLRMKQYTVTASVKDNVGGTIEPVGEKTLAYDESQTYAIAVSEGYNLADVLVDGESVGAVTSYEFKRVRANHTIEAQFVHKKIDSLKVTLSPEEAVVAGAAWSVDGGTTWYESGQTVTDLDAGDFVLSFKGVNGYAAPALQYFTIDEGDSYETTAQYTEIEEFVPWKLYGAYSLNGINATVSSSHIAADSENNLYIGGYGALGDAQKTAAVIKFAANGKIAPTEATLLASRNRNTETPDWGANTNGYLGLSQTTDGGVVVTIDGSAGSPQETLKFKTDGTLDTTWRDGGKYIVGPVDRLQCNAVLEDGTVVLPQLFMASKKSVRLVKNDETLNLTVDGVADHARDIAAKGNDTLFILANGYKTIYKVTFVASDYSNVTVSEFANPAGAAGNGGLFYNKADNTLTHASGCGGGGKQSLSIYNADTGELLQTLTTAANVPGLYNDAVVIKDANLGDMMYGVSSDRNMGVYKRIAFVKVNLGNAPAGAQWSVDGGTTWFDNDATAEVFDSEETFVTFKDVTGYNTPAPLSFVGDKSQLTEIILADDSYTRIIGSVQVNIEPEAVVEGAGWMLVKGAPYKAAAGEWHKSGEVEENVPVDQYTVTFKSVAGYDKPEDMLADVTSSEKLILTGIYTKSKATLIVNINGPAESRWSIDNFTTSYQSGTAIKVDSGNTYTVKFNDVEGWTKPEDKTVDATDVQIYEVKATYTQILGAISVSISPGDAVADGAAWSIDSGLTWHTSGATITDLKPGTYGVVFREIYEKRWAAPIPQTVSVTAGTTTLVEGVYRRYSAVDTWELF